VTTVEDGPAELQPAGDEYPAVKVASAEVIEIWKGPITREVRYVASPTRYCDIASARVGERVVLFLEKRKESGIMMVAHLGRGGMPLREVEGKSYATLWSKDVLLPAGTATIAGPEPKYSFIRSVELKKLKELVLEKLRQK
jgi:hypothetical protein